MDGVEAMVIVSAHELPAGAVIEASDLYAVRFGPEMWGGWPSVPYSDPAAVVGRAVTIPLLANEVVVPERLGLAPPSRLPAEGTIGLVVSGEPARVVDLLHPSEGCTALTGATVLRIGRGTLLVQVAPSALPVLAGRGALAAVAPGEGPPACSAGLDVDEGPPVARQAPVEPIFDDADVIEVWTAIRDLPTGRVVRRVDVAGVWLTRVDVPDAAVRDPLGRTLTGPMFRGEPFREERLEGVAADPAVASIPFVVAESLPGAPWWPTDAVAVLDGSACVAAVGAVVATPRARSGLADDDAVRELGSREVGVAGPTVLPRHGTIVALPPSGVPAGLCRAAPPAPPPAPVAPIAASGRTRRDLERAIDWRADPCVDFYQFACGGSRGAAVGMDGARLRNTEILLDLLAHDKGPLGRLYGECTDREAIAAAGLRPLAGWTDAIARVGSAEEAVAVSGSLLAIGVPSWFQVVRGDEGPVVYVQPPDPPSPEREWQVAELLRLAGDPDPAASAAAVVALDRALAAATSGPTFVISDENASFHAENDRARGRLDAMLRSLGVRPADVQVGNGIHHTLDLLDVTPPKVLRDALLVQLLSGTAPQLGDTARAPELAYGWWHPPLTTEEQCLRTLWSVAPRAVDHLFSGSSVRPAAIERASSVFGRVNGHLIRAVDDFVLAQPPGERDATRDLGQTARGVKWSIGESGPGQEDLAITGAWFADWSTARAARVRSQLAGESEPSEGGADVNASYLTEQNWIVLLPGILVPPMFDRRASEARVYGGLGAIIGHELTHAFLAPFTPPLAVAHLMGVEDIPSSDPVRRYDVKADLACVLENTRSAPFPSEAPVDAWETLDEAAADIGGLDLAYRAWKASDSWDSWEFFLAYAQTFCSAEPDRQAPGDPHPPPRFRVDATLGQFAPFAETFGCEADEPMVGEQECSLWE